jgi:hypothetical protein
MNLLQVRQLFRNLSGRFDLVNVDGSDNGANFFINEGRKFLDRLDETKKSWAAVFRYMETGFWSVQFPYCRAIKEVYAATSSERWQLEKVDLQDLMEGYLTGLPSSRTTGTPTYFSPCIGRYIPEQLPSNLAEAVTGWVDIMSGNAHEWNAILVDVPASEKLTIQVHGLFYSMELVNDTDENYWSICNPMMLYMSAMRQIEVANRNTQGVKDWESAIRTEVSQLGMDLVEELIAEVDEMEG